VKDDLKRALEHEARMGTDDVVLPKCTAAETAVSVKPTDPSAQDFDDLDSFREAICECQKCALGKTRNKFVFGVGNPDADIVFVGEAPGADEDRQGEPFVGRAGKLLDKILDAIGFDRSQVYIANILKCRPPNNRDPQPAEMDECIPYLEKQIRMIRPQFICCLGRIAAQRLLETKTPLGKLRGEWFERYGARVMVTYHPAALLRFADYKRDTWEDVQRLREAYDQWKESES
jgi:uracil-DNA glycosylase family 4